MRQTPLPSETWRRVRWWPAPWRTRATARVWSWSRSSCASTRDISGRSSSAWARRAAASGLAYKCILLIELKWNFFKLYIRVSRLRLDVTPVVKSELDFVEVGLISIGFAQLWRTNTELSASFLPKIIAVANVVVVVRATFLSISVKSMGKRKQRSIWPSLFSGYSRSGSLPSPACRSS